MQLPYNSKILIVSGHTDSLREIAAMLRKNNFSIMQAQTGRQCLEIVKNDRPNLVILDINLPDINGIEVCRLIKSDTEPENIYVLLIDSDNMTSPYQDDVCEAGTDGFLMQPFTQHELHARVNPLIKLIHSEKENRYIQNQLKESENRYNSLVENSDDLIAICRDNKLLFINKTGLKLLHVNSIEEIKGKDIASFIYPDKRNIVLRRIEIALKTGSSYLTDEVFQTTDGKSLPIEIKVMPIIYGGLSSIHIIGKDISGKISEHRKLEEYAKELEEKVQFRLDEVREKSAKLEESQRALTYLLEDVNESRTELEMANRNLQMLNRELEAFTYSVSHDLRAPIRAIDGFSRILMEENANQLDEEGKRLLSIIVKSATNMQRLIDDLLAFSRLGPKQPAMHKIDSGVLISNIIDELKTGNPDRKIIWKVSDLPEIYGDQGMLKQVFTNILGNAVKFTSKSEEAVIEVDGDNNGVKTNIRIKDNGVGFNMKYAHKIFEVFQRLHDSKEFEGTGIGMAIVKKILDKHNGQIVPESKPGVGSIFTIELPHI